MSDLKAQFKQLKEQRGSSAPTAAQIRALKFQKKAGGQAAPQSAPSKPAQPSQPAKAGAAASLPANFFDTQPAKKQAVMPAGAPASATPVARPVTKSVPSTGAGLGSVLGVHNDSPAPGAAALPEGFFANKEADAKARGVKLPDAKDREAEFQEFQRMMEEQVKDLAAQEAEAAEEEAADKEGREDFIQWVRMQRLEDLKKKKAVGQQSEDGGEGGVSGSGEGPGAAEDEVGLGEEATPGPSSMAQVAAELLGMPTAPDGLGPLKVVAKRKRVIDTLSALLPGGESSEDEQGGVSEEDLLDWRSKGM